MGLILLTVIVVALSMFGMGVGVIFSNRCLRGACGGASAEEPEAESLACGTCPLRPPQ